MVHLNFLPLQHLEASWKGGLYFSSSDPLGQPSSAGKLGTQHLPSSPHATFGPPCVRPHHFCSSQQTCGSLHGMLIQSPVHRSWWCGHTPSLPHSNAFAAAHRLVSLHTLQSMSFLWSVLKCSHWTGTHPYNLLGRRKPLPGAQDPSQNGSFGTQRVVNGGIWPDSLEQTAANPPKHANKTHHQHPPAIATTSL